jgi:hypothetical protein|tara:strand:+ start:104 stop:409 length:306 start_codon:yes stop_codon:yes gene_type:complete
MQEVKILRLSTGEDVIAKVGENDQGVSLKNPFVIIPQQKAPGQPIQLMMSLYNAFGKSNTITVAKDKIVFITDPKDEILKSYENNTSTIIAPKPGLITENK